MITEYPHFSRSAIHGFLFHIHGHLMAYGHLDIGAVQGMGDRVDVFGYLW